MQILITAAPIFHLPLSLDDLRLLNKMASTHYDGVCRSASNPGPDGFLYGWIGRVQAQAEDPDHVPGSERIQAHSRELDIMLKVLENIGGLAEEEKAAARYLARNLAQVVRYAGGALPHWRTVFGGVHR